MPIVGLNHAVVSVRDLERSVAFYERVLGFQRLEGQPRGLRGRAAFLRAPGSTNDHDLGLFELDGDGADDGSTGQGRSAGLIHLAWEVDTLAELQRLHDGLAADDALIGATDHGATKSLYGRDPDGLEFEIAWVVPADRLDDDALAGRMRLRRLDLARERDRYGSETQGGIGISR